jgi:hypothetical protein
LAERLDAAERLLGNLIDRTATELRTQRIVVTEADGFERVVIAGAGTHGEVTVAARTATGDATAVELYAHDPSGGDAVSVGVALIDLGDVAGSFDVFEGTFRR